MSQKGCDWGLLRFHMGYIGRAERNDYALSLLIEEPGLMIYTIRSHIHNKWKKAGLHVLVSLAMELAATGHCGS